MDFQGLKDVLSKYGTILIIKEGAVFSLLMKGDNLSNMKKVQDIQSTVLDYAEKKYPIIEVFRNDDRYLCMVLKPEVKTGIQLIAKERQEQFEKHGISIGLDIIHNSSFEKPLTKAASALTIEHGNGLAMETMKPSNWDAGIWYKMMSKPYKERLIIAGALIAAEIDRLTAVEKENS